MKSIINDFATICYALLFLISTKSLAQENSSFTITPELSKQIIEKNQIRQFKIYPVSYKEVAYHAIDTGQIMTKEYKYVLESIEKNKSEYELYTNAILSNLEKRESIKIIVANIDKFLNSDEKYEIKEKYLIDSQALVAKYKFEVIISEKESLIKGFLANPNATYQEQKLINRKIVLYEKNKKINKSDLKLYQQAIQKTRIDEPQKTQEYKRYLENVEELPTIKKTETGKVLSSKVSKRFAYMINETSVDINSISGIFTELPEAYMLVLSNKDNDRLENELITKLKYDDVGNERYQIIQNVDTKELYFVMSHKFLSDLQREQRNQELLDIVHKLGYKEYSGDGNVYIKSKTSEIILDLWTYQELKKNSSYISKLDSDQIQIASLVQQTISHSRALDTFVSRYRIQKNKMSTADINTWRNTTKQADKLWQQIYKIQEKYHGNNSFNLLKKSDTFEVFGLYITASKGILMM